jgi:enoyl-CoA hydratase/carnithine racemase
VSVIAALNGPTTVHSEYVLLCDVVIATPDTVFQDKPHFGFGIVPGDGIHSLWPHVIGSIRGRYFVLTQQMPDAKEAKELGVVNEIVSRAHLHARAREIATGIAKLPPLTASCTRVALSQPLRRLVDESVGYGLALRAFPRPTWLAPRLAIDRPARQVASRHVREARDTGKRSLLHSAAP